MRDLQLFSIPLEIITLERINPTSREYKKAILKMRDFHAKKMMYDIKPIFCQVKK